VDEKAPVGVDGTPPARPLLSAVRRHAVVVVVVLAVALGGGWLVTQLMPTTYATQTTVLLRPQPDGEAVSVAEAAALVEQQVATYAALVTTPAVLDPAIQRAGVDTDAAELAEQVSATAVPQTTLIQIEVEGDDARQTAELAAGVAGSLIDTVSQQSQVGSQSLVSGQVVEEPLVPEDPDSPRLALNLAVALALGVAVSAAVVALRERTSSQPTRGR
jgi:capsular polysaccharide biosynthesis protein